MRGEIISFGNFNKRRAATTDKGCDVSLFSIDERKGAIRAVVDGQCVVSTFRVQVDQSFHSKAYGTLIYQSDD